MPIALPLTLLILGSAEPPANPASSVEVDLPWQVIDVQSSAKSSDPKPWMSERRPTEIDAPAPIPLQARFDDKGRPQVFHAPAKRAGAEPKVKDIPATAGEEPKQ